MNGCCDGVGSADVGVATTVSPMPVDATPLVVGDSHRNGNGEEDAAADVGELLA